MTIKTINQNTAVSSSKLGKPFWVVWAIELWERFGFYGVQAILTLYFVQKLGYSESVSFYVFGSFSAFVYGFIWLGGWLGDNYLGAKRTMTLGAIILMLSYFGLAIATPSNVFYVLAGIIVGGTLFKANPSSLISKMYEKGDPALDSAMTMYYMAINIGSTFSMAITPILAQRYGWSSAFWFCGAGLFLGLGNYFIYRKLLASVNTAADKFPFNLKRVLLVLVLSVISIVVVANLLIHTPIVTIIVYIVVTGGFLYFLKLAFGLKGMERKRMLVAFALILQAVLFFVLYNQMPTTLIFFALHNINNNFFGWAIPPAEYQVLNPLVIVLVSPFLVCLYKKIPATHATKFCIGMTLCAVAFLVLWIPQYTTTNGIASPLFIVATYLFQSIGELFISALGLAMVAELCPSNRSGFVMGIWFLTTMLAGPIGAWVGSLTAPPESNTFTAIESMRVYSHVFLQIGIVTGIVAMLMWIARPFLNKGIFFLKEAGKGPAAINTVEAFQTEVENVMHKD